MSSVVVAMSGGVDSALSAVLLHQAGYQVIGVHMRLSEPPEDEQGYRLTRTCCGLDAADDARRVCTAFDIPFYVLNFEREFREWVIDYFCQEYARGRTPNPCLACNTHIKFRFLLDRAAAVGAEYLATGHYARRRQEEGAVALYKGADPLKDQSYFLYTMTQEQLRRVLLPVGDLEKTETRRLAETLALPVAAKPDSQEICFIPDHDYRSFLRETSPEVQRPGPIVDGEGRRLGTHEGLAFYTVGQRRGLGLATGEPAYVVGLLPRENTVLVGPREQLWRQELTASDLSLIAGGELPGPERVAARIRYRGREAPAVIEPLPGHRVRVRFDEPQRAIAPGQAVVFYDGERVVGGATIE